ncbi:hypothetical protein D9757_013294 [Collybiopsis confluens]|uniref:Uncharacterized protein n=1 Tax=Collybiopsis confluens TaxID=2823264 RepID=A0A8H5LJ39_9AGAR|nr:hypothetical protein D9757_013294 [Collybiopsis confluens]
MPLAPASQRIDYSYPLTPGREGGERMRKRSKGGKEGLLLEDERLTRASFFDFDLLQLRSRSEVLYKPTSLPLPLPTQDPRPKTQAIHPKEADVVRKRKKQPSPTGEGREGGGG